MLVKRKDLDNQQALINNWSMANCFPGGKYSLDPVEIDKAYDKYRQQIIDGYHGKPARPWEIIDITRGLDKDAVWVGIEIEMGFKDTYTMKRTREYILDNFDYVTCDIEGGEFPVEATFPPVEVGKLFTSDSYLTQYYNDVLSKRGAATKHSPQDWVGTHVNISTPKYRNNPDSAWSNAMSCVDEALEHIGVGENAYNFRSVSTYSGDAKVCQQLFGRVPYSGINPNSGRSGKWIELKLFNSTTDFEVLQWYVKVSELIAKLIDDDDITTTKAERELRNLATESPIKVA